MGDSAPNLWRGSGRMLSSISNLCSSGHWVVIGIFCSSSASDRSTAVGEWHVGEWALLSLSLAGGDRTSKLNALAPGETSPGELFADLGQSIVIRASQGKRDSH